MPLLRLWNRPQARNSYCRSATFILTFTLLLRAFSAGEGEKKAYTLGFIAVLSGNQTFEKRYYIGAIEYAVRYVNEHKLLGKDAILKYIYTDTKGDPLRSIKAMTDFYQNKVTAFIGPSTDKCITEALIASAWNKPLVSFRCRDSEVTESKLKYPTFVRTLPPTKKVAKYIITILKHYGWHKCVLVVGKADGLTRWMAAADALKNHARQGNVTITDVKYFKEPYVPTRYASDTLSSIVTSTMDRTRVYVFLGEKDALIDFARRKQAILQEDEGKYVILAVQEGYYQENKRDLIFKWTDPISNKSSDTIDPMDSNTLAIRNILYLLQQPPANETKYRAFRKDCLNLTLQTFKQIPRPPSFLEKQAVDWVTIYAAYLHDAVIVFAHGLRRALSKGIDPNNGTALTNAIINTTYQSIQGYDMSIDESGDAEANYILTALQARKWLIVGNFSKNNGSLSFHSRDIKWINGKPVTEPECGFKGEACKSEQKRTGIIIGCVLVPVVLLGVAMLYRHYRYEQKLASLLWKIEYKDLLITEGELNDSTMSERPKRRDGGRPSLLFPDECREGTAVPHRPVAIKVASYKGSLVTVRMLRRRHVEITRSVRKELQVVKELVHDNVNRFIGACIDPPNMCIVTQYCARGSLKDILENDDLNLDDMFIASLIFDLIRGMIFLHDSEIGSHGNLKPSNCVVDSRWVLQISDFGLHQLKGCEFPSLCDEDSYYGRLLWRAPELLRDPGMRPKGTQKGDVYSFSIILFEVHSRSGPWGPTMYSPREIIERLKYPPDGFILRPDTYLLKCEDLSIRCIRECWHETPECRPDFKAIRILLKHMQRGLKSNIFDNMLAIMEKYANNLEVVVAARTEQLEEEKKKTEALLHRMLPRTVADQLKQGVPVSPEHYNMVTIYFSDIVGFTAISAESTPLQVVDLLNDLYTCFDSIIGEYDVYKVETIGDAYMVVSGLPIRNGDNHAGEIASMSLHLLHVISTFRIRHRPEDKINLRIGIHSGPCVAGVVGLKMPRYCLFGDTVNTTSRMESTGVPLKVHCSGSCKQLLTKLGGYLIEERGLVSIKGKGEMFTFFVVGEDKSHRLRRISVEQRPWLADVTLPSLQHQAAPRSVTEASCTSSLHSFDSGADTEGVQLLNNGSVPFFKVSCSYANLESQV